MKIIKIEVLENGHRYKTLIDLLSRDSYIYTIEEKSESNQVQAGVSVKTADDWINIKEKLPEIGTEVIVYCPKCTVRKVTALARFIRYEEATDYYWDNAYGGSNIHVMDSVTHWKPMPNKPNR